VLADEKGKIASLKDDAPPNVAIRGGLRRENLLGGVALGAWGAVAQKEL